MWDGQYIAAHRFSFLISRDGVLTGKMVCHTCDHPACVHPDHLFLGDAKDNVQDAARKGRHVNPVMRGELNPQARLTPTQVKAIRAQAEIGVDKSVLMKTFGVSRRHLNRILKKERW